MIIEPNDHALGRKYAEHLRKTQPYRSIARHRQCVAKEMDAARQEQENKQKVKAVEKAFAANATKEAKHIMSLVDRQNQIYDMAMLGATLALYVDKKDPATGKRALRQDRDLKGLAACLGQAAAITAQMKGSDPGIQQITTINNYDNLSKEELRELVKLTAKIEGTEEGTGKT